MLQQSLAQEKERREDSNVMRITGVFSVPPLCYQNSESFKDFKTRERLPNPEWDSSEREELSPDGLVGEELLGLPMENLVDTDSLKNQKKLGKLRKGLSFSVCPGSSRCDRSELIALGPDLVIPGCDGSESTLGPGAGLYRW